MTRQKSSAAILAVIFAASALAAPAQDKVQLRLQLKKGQSYKQEMVSDQEISQTIQGQRLDMTQTTGMGFTYDVEEVRADGTAVIKVTYDSVLLKQKGPTGNFQYDSKNPPQTVHPMAQGFAALVGQGFTMEMTPEGTVTKVEGVDEMLTHMMKNIKVQDESTRETMEKKLKQQFGNQALKEMMENMMAIYPDKPVRIGDSWNKRVTISKGFAMIIDNTWTLKDRRDGIAVVEVKSTIKPNPNAKPLDLGPLTLRYNIGGKQQGEMEIDEATGWVMQAKMTQNLSGEVQVQSGAGALGDMKWPISIKSNINFKTPPKKIETRATDKAGTPTRPPAAGPPRAR